MAPCGAPAVARLVEDLHHEPTTGARSRRHQSTLASFSPSAPQQVPNSTCVGIDRVAVADYDGELALGRPARLLQRRPPFFDGGYQFRLGRSTTRTRNRECTRSKL